MATRQYYVYIMANKYNTTLYVGMTNNLIRRINEHKAHIDEDSFTKRYNINKLVYFEVFYDPRSAIEREKQLKAGSRKKKMELVVKDNPGWKDLYESLVNGM